MNSPEDIQSDILSKEHAELKEVNEDLIIQQKEVNPELSNENTRLIELEKKIKDLTTERDELDRTKESLIQDLEHVQKKSVESRTQLDDELHLIREKLARAEKSYVLIETDNARLRLAKTDALEKLATTEKNYVLLETDNARLHLAKTDALEKLATTEKNYVLLESDSARLHLAKTDALERLSDVESKVKYLSQRERVLQESLSDANKTIQSREVEIENLKKQVVEEEDKRNKSLTLLKKTQQKIMSLEKEKKDLSEEAERAQDNARASEQNVISGLKQEIAKFGKELNAKSTQITRLESLNEKISEEKQVLFEQLQIRQAEFESSQTTLENFEHRSNEIEHQMKEAEERSQALEEELVSMKIKHKEKIRENEKLMNHIEKIENESKEKLGVMESQIDTYREEKEKIELELREIRQSFDSKIQDSMNRLNASEMETKKLIANSKENESTIGLLSKENQTFKNKIQDLEEKIKNMQNEVNNAQEKSTKYNEYEITIRNNKEEYEKLMEDCRMREGHLKTVNKTLREEVRKLQKVTPSSPSSPIYPRHSISSASSTLVDSGLSNLDDDLKVNYFKDVFLKFLEHRDKRKALLPVISTLFKLSPEEKKRLELKYGR